MRLFIQFICFVLLAQLPFDLSAHEGWDLIKQNDNRAARSIFIKRLESDSTDIHSLKGLIYLSEIEQDKLSFKKYINTLINNHWDENVFLTFESLYEGKVESILKQTTFSEKAKMGAKIRLAESFMEKRQFEQSQKIYSEVIKDYKWSLIGPFKNISGSGHIVNNVLETESFNNSKIYKNEAGLELKWIQPKFVNTNGKLTFSDHLPNDYKGSVYFANTFIDVPQKTTVQFRIGRSAPMKIWLDDQLIFDAREKINFSWDNEIVELQLTAGTHRILIKNSTSPGSPKSYKLLTFYDENSSGISNGSSDDFSFLFGSLYNSGEAFALRITDTKGNLINQINPSPGITYNPANYQVVTTEQKIITYYHGLIQKDPEDLFNYYMLCKAYLQAGLAKKAEEFFVKTLRTQKNSVIFKYLTAKLYAKNGKIEKAYTSLNDIDHAKTPVFGLLYEKLQDIDLNNEEQKYLEALDKLKSVTPSNYAVIAGYLKYYDKKGMQKEKEDYINRMKKAYPVYESSLNYELTHSDNKPYKSRTDKEKQKETKKAIRNTKSRFSAFDYTTAISYYKGRDNFKKVIELYDDLIEHLPYLVSYRKDKASYLHTEGKYEAALTELEKVLTISPYDNDAMEQLGDIYFDMKGANERTNKQKALSHYYLAKKYGSKDYDIEEKIEKIQGQQTKKKLFATKSFDDILNDKGWKDRYSDEESIILMYTRDLVYDTVAHVDVYQQLMIKILTEAGAKSWIEYDFSFLGKLNMVKVIKNNGAEIVPDRQGGHVVFKNLEPGDLIQIDGVFNWDQSTELDKELSLIHYISFEVPIYYKKFEVALPQGTYLNYLYNNLHDNLVKSTNGHYDHYLWEYYNVNKVEREDAIIDNYDLYSTIMISTLPDWSKVVNWYKQTTYRKLELTYEVKEALDSIIKPNMSPEKKVEAIYNYLTKEIKYSYVSFLQSGYVPKDPALTLSSKIGDCKDVATLMITMLREVGIESYYTLVKTNSFNHQEILPSLYFDHVIVYYNINGKPGYLDMTTDFYPHYVLTENDVNAWALIIKEGEKEIFQLPNDDFDPSKNTIEYNISASLNIDRSVDLKVNARYPGISGGSIREELSGISKLEQRNYVLDLLNKGAFQDINLITYAWDNLNDISQALQSSYLLRAYEFSDNVSDLLICRIPFVSTVQPNPAILSKARHNNLSVTALGNAGPVSQKIYFTFPEGYQLFRLPENIAVKNKFGSYEVKFSHINNGIYVEKYQTFNFRKVNKEEFEEFKKFYLTLLGLDKTKIVLQAAKAISH